MAAGQVPGRDPGETVRDQRLPARPAGPLPLLPRPLHAARVRADSVCFSSPPHAIVMWNIASPIAVVVVSIQGSGTLRSPPPQARSGRRRWRRRGPGGRLGPARGTTTRSRLPPSAIRLITNFCEEPPVRVLVENWSLGVRLKVVLLTRVRSVRYQEPTDGLRRVATPVTESCHWSAPPAGCDALRHASQQGIRHGRQEARRAAWGTSLTLYLAFTAYGAEAGRSRFCARGS